MHGPGITSRAHDPLPVTSRPRHDQPSPPSLDFPGGIDAFELATVGMVLTDTSGRFQRVNPAFAALIGRGADALVGASFTSLTSPEDVDRSEAIMRRMLEGASPVERFEKRYLLPGGRTVWIDMSVRALARLDGRVFGFMAQAVDITAHRAAEEAAERDHRLLLDAERAVGLGSFVHDAEADVIRGSEGFCAILGIPVGTQLRVEALLAHVHPEDRAAVANAIATCQSERTAVQLDHRLLAGGAVRWLQVRAAWSGSANEGSGALLGTVWDITARKAAEAAVEEHRATIQKSERRLRDALEAMLDSVMLLSPIRDASGEVTDFRVGYSNLGNPLGPPLDQDLLTVTGTLLRELHPEVAERAIPWLARALTSGTPVEMDAVPIPLGPLGIGLDQIRHYTIKAAPCGEDLLVVLHDVTAALESSRHREQLIRERERLAERLSAVLDSADEGVYAVDMEGRCLLVNRAACEMLGRTEAELLGVEWHSAVHHTLPTGAPYPEESCPMHSTLRAGVRHHRLDETFWTADGRPFEVQYSAVPLVEGERTTGAVVIFQNVTERRHADDALRELRVRAHQAEELAGLGVWMRTFGGRQLALSPMARRIMGFGASEMVTQQDVLARLDPDQRPLVMHVDETSGERDWQGELHLHVPGGEERWVVTQVRLVRDRDGRPQGLLGAGVDITLRKRSDARLKAYAARQSGLAGIARRGLTDRPDAVLKSATRVAARTLGGDIAGLYRYEGDRMIRLTSYGSPSLPREWVIRDFPAHREADRLRGRHQRGRLRARRRPLSVPLRERGVRSSAMVAIRGRESPYGALFVHSLVPRVYSEADLRWLELIADVVSVAIERTRVDEELKATVIELTNLDDQRRSLLGHLVKAQEDERHRIAAGLHDDVVQLMAAINLRLEVLRRRGDLDADGNVGVQISLAV